MSKKYDLIWESNHGDELDCFARIEHKDTPNETITLIFPAESKWTKTPREIIWIGKRRSGDALTVIYDFRCDDIEGVGTAIKTRNKVGVMEGKWRWVDRREGVSEVVDVWETSRLRELKTAS